MTAISTAAQLAASLERQIVAGTLAPGDRLDPVRSAAVELDLAPNTVASAYRTLAERGLVIGRGRSGTFISAPMSQFSIEPVVPEDVVDLATGNPDPELLPDLTATLRRIDPPETMYGAAPVLTEFEGAVRQCMMDAPGPMLTVSGALDGVERVLGAHLRPGDRVGIENPGWPAMADLIRSMLLRPVPISIDPQGPDPVSLSAVIRGVDAVVFTSRVQNPTGACITGPRSQDLASILADNPEVLVIEDDHAGPISGVPLRTLGHRSRRWALSASMSKAIGPDLRIAAVFGDESTIELVRRRQGVGPGWVSHLLQRLAADLITTSGPAMSKATATYAERRNEFIEALGRAGIEVEAPSGLNVWVPVSDPSRSVAACLEAGYAVRSGTAFVLDDTKAIRVTTSRMTAAQGAEVASVIAASSRPRPRHTRSG